MKKITHHIFSRSTAALVLAGFTFSILFGQGTHVHSIFDHIFDHGDIHVYVHSHSHSINHKHEGTGFDFEDSHNHPISTLSLKSVRTYSPLQEMVQSTKSFLSVVAVSSESIADDLLPTYLDLPPPDQIPDLYHFYSYSLRAPPVG